MVVARGFGHGEDEGGAGGFGDAFVAVRGAGVEVDGVAFFKEVFLAVVGQFEAAGEHVEELGAGVLVGAQGSCAVAVGGGAGEELGDVGDDALAGGGGVEAGDLAEGLEEVVGVVDAGLGEALAVGGADDAEELRLVRLEEVAHVAGEDHGDAGEVAEGGDDAAGFELGEEAGGEAGVFAELDQAHLLAEAEELDALAEALGFEQGLGRFGGDAGVVCGVWRGLGGGDRSVCGRGFALGLFFGHCKTDDEVWAKDVLGVGGDLGGGCSRGEESGWAFYPRFAGTGKKQVSPLRCAPVEMTSCKMSGFGVGAGDATL